MKTAIALFVVLLAAPILAVSAKGSSATPVPAIVSRAAAVHAANMRGIIGMQRHFSTVLHAGPFRHTEQSDSGLLMNDGSFAKIKYVSIADDGKVFNPRQIAKRDAETNQDWSLGKVFFKEPYDPRFLRDYGFDPPQACLACPAGTVAVNFRSNIRDTQHGNGTMWIESATGRVDRLTYAPNVLPPHATSGIVTETSGWALPNVWCATRIDSTYQGRILMWKGTGTFTGVFDHFRHFATLARGEAALGG